MSAHDVPHKTGHVLYRIRSTGDQPEAVTVDHIHSTLDQPQAVTVAGTTVYFRVQLPSGSTDSLRCYL